MQRRTCVGVTSALAACLVGSFLAFAADKKEVSDGERSVKQEEVPPAALASLKNLAGNASFTEFAEEVEHGHKFYEGSWKGPNGKVDALVTESGDVVEIEESMAAGKVPAAVRAAAIKQAGDGAAFERKTVYLYEIHYQKDGQEQELIFTADARPHHEQGHQEAKVKEKK